MIRVIYAVYFELHSKKTSLYHNAIKQSLLSIPPFRLKKSKKVACDLEPRIAIVVDSPVKSRTLRFDPQHTLVDQKLLRKQLKMTTQPTSGDAGMKSVPEETVPMILMKMNKAPWFFKTRFFRVAMHLVLTDSQIKTNVGQYIFNVCLQNYFQVMHA